MIRRHQTAVQVMLLGLIAFAIGMVAFALATGQIRGKYNWVSYAENPTTFCDWFFGYTIAAMSMSVFLWALRHRARL